MSQNTYTIISRADAKRQWLLQQSKRFLDNKYFKLYVTLCCMPDDNGYTETHHILPRCMGGTDDDDNLVTFSSRKHFLCHYLLTKCIVKNTNGWHKSIHAFKMMKCGTTEQQRYFNSRLYEANRSHIQQTMSKSQSGSKNSQYGKCWIHREGTLTSKKIYKEEIDHYITTGWKRGRVISVDKKQRKQEQEQKKADSALKARQKKAKAIENAYYWYNLYIGGDYESLTHFIEDTQYPHSKPSLTIMWKRHVVEYVPKKDRRSTEFKQKMSTPPDP